MANGLLPALDRAATSGQPVAVGLAAILSAGRSAFPAGLLHRYRSQYLVLFPVYAGGRRPTTVAARDASLGGWVLADFDGSTVIRSAVPAASGLAIALESHGVALASTGPAAGRGWLALSVPIPSGAGTAVVVRVPASSAPLLQGIVLGLLAMAVTLLLFWFTFHLGRSRERALRLVEERTEDLRYQAMHDTLTGLPNRALLFDRAEQMLIRARRQPRAVGALYLDLDNFKDVNDSLGHQAGDELLKAVACRLKGAVRESDTVGRLGGDEFLILTEEDPSAEGPELIADRVIAALEEPFVLHTPEPLTLQVRASVGVAAGVRSDAGELIRDADVAMYQAKEAGKGRLVTFRPEMQTAVQDRMALELDLRRAVDAGELFLLYQPIFDLADMTTKGVEALVRWRHPTRGELQPAAFIPVAEQSGLIVPIGHHILEQACAQAARWHGQGYRIGMSVNVAAAQFEHLGFAESVRSAIERNRLPAGALTLEINESLLMKDGEATARVMNELKAIGVRIALDDTGTGYSTLAYLRQFPIDSLKIDRTFIARASNSARAGALIHALVQLGKALEIETLAEGIEERSQLTALQQERCDSGQGYLYARPLPPDELVPYFFSPNAAQSGLVGA